MALIASLSIISFLAVTGGAMLIRGLSEIRLSERSYRQSAAFHLAEAGIQQALVNLRTFSSADDVTSGTQPTGTFWLEMTTLGPLTTQVMSHGQSTSERKDLEAIVDLVGQSAFRFALFGDQLVEVGGSALTNSYDSRLGPYDPDTAQHEGNVGTNATSTGGMDLSGSIFIDGQVFVGPGVEDPTSVIDGYDPNLITGNPDVVSQPYAFPMPPVSVPQGVTCSDLKVAGNEVVTLSATGGSLGNGTYCYDDLTVQGGGTLNSDGDVTVYLTGELIAHGNSSMIGVEGDPTQMLFLMTAGAEASIQEGTITGSNAFYGAIYGPDAEIKITGNAQVYGSIVAQEVNLKGSAVIHYDEALGESGKIVNTYKASVIAWRGLN